MPFIKLNKSKLSQLLSAIHTHAEIANHEDENQIVYKERDIVELLQILKENRDLLNDFEVQK